MKNLVLGLGLVFSLALTSCGHAGEWKDVNVGAIYLQLHDDGSARIGRDYGKWEDYKDGFRTYGFSNNKNNQVLRPSKNDSWVYCSNKSTFCFKKN